MKQRVKYLRAGICLQEMAANRNEEQNAANRGPWAWPRFRHGPQPVEVHNNNNPLDDNGPEEEEDEEDPAHPHRR